MSERMRRWFAEYRVLARQFFTNWREYEAPWTTKLALGVRNRVRATLSPESCCGHPGEPGC